VAVVAILGVGAFLLLGGDDSGSGGGSGPESAIRAFFDAGKSGDCDKIIGLMTNDSFSGVSKDMAVSGCKQAMKSGSSSGLLGSKDTLDGTKLKSQKGDKAVVEVTSTTDGKKKTEEVHLRKEDGTWKIDLAASGIDTSSGDDSSSSDTTDTSLDIGSSTDTSVDFGSLPDECNPQSSSYNLDECTSKLGSGG
jgi:hypothetical protein